MESFLVIYRATALCSYFQLVLLDLTTESLFSLSLYLLRPTIKISIGRATCVFYFIPDMLNFPPEFLQSRIPPEDISACYNCPLKTVYFSKTKDQNSLLIITQSSNSSLIPCLSRKPLTVIIKSLRKECYLVFFRVLHLDRFILSISPQLVRNSPSDYIAG